MELIIIFFGGKPNKEDRLRSGHTKKRKYIEESKKGMSK